MRCFVGIVVIVALFAIFTRDKEYSYREDRALARLEKPTMQGFLKGELPDKTETYLKDQFVGRDYLTRARVVLLKFLGQDAWDGIYQGKNHYLLQEYRKADEARLSETAEAVNAFANRHASLPMRFLAAPTSAEILADKLPAAALVDSQIEDIRDLYGRFEEGRIQAVDVSKTLRNHSEEEIYYRTDSHWTTVGAYYAYREFAQEIGLNTADDKYEAMPVSNDFQGNLASRSGFEQDTYEQIKVYFNSHSEFDVSVTYADTGERSPSMYQAAALEHKEQYDTFLRGKHSLVAIDSTANSTETLLVMKDDYANCFIPFLTSHYQRIIVVDPALYTGDVDELIREEKITDVLFLYSAQTLAEDTSLASFLRRDDFAAQDGNATQASATAAQTAAAAKAPIETPVRAAASGAADGSDEDAQAEDASDQESQEGYDESYDESGYDENYDEAGYDESYDESNYDESGDWQGDGSSYEEDYNYDEEGGQ